MGTVSLTRRKASKVSKNQEIIPNSIKYDDDDADDDDADADDDDGEDDDDDGDGDDDDDDDDDDDETLVASSMDR